MQAFKSSPLNMKSLNHSTSHSHCLDQLIVFSLLIGAAIGDFAYKPSGWRPTGPSFTPHDNRLRSNGYSNKPGTSYGVPDSYPSISSVADVDQTSTTLTPRTPPIRERTTPFSIDDNDDDDDDNLQSNPALAIANSFAFNKPVYVYNGIFPFNPSFAIVK